MNEEQNIKEAIAKLKNNFLKYKSANSWHSNIIDASKNLNTKTEWVHFYHYLANPAGYDFEKVVVSEYVDIVDEVPNFEQDKRFETVVYKNGNEAVIHLKNTNFHRLDNDQEEEKKEN